MRWRWAILLLILYLGADFANPLMPGAVSFDAEDSVEGLRVDRAQAPVPAVVPPDPLSGVRVVLVPLVSRPRAVAPRRRRRRPALRLARSASPSPSSEDH